MHRSGQTLFRPHAKLKQREETTIDYRLFFIVAPYMSENQNGYIYNIFVTILVCFVEYTENSLKCRFHFIMKCKR
ncbi:hypothetical protein COC54_16670 [Bacillus pseudomycoides]|nr:hypothetical protein CN564_17390 [Bacillus pseudomycoides]PGS03468.1 hypothetical protein COC54_16670 [Bacillus pseudomycoides]PHC96667.1 hypothetical protein COF36_05520 [Bacillus pseudomycoides]